MLTADGVLLLLERKLVGGGLPLLGHGLGWGGSLRAEEVEEGTGGSEGSDETAGRPETLARGSDGLARTVGTEGHEVSCGNGSGSANQ